MRFSDVICPLIVVLFFFHTGCKGRGLQVTPDLSSTRRILSLTANPPFDPPPTEQDFLNAMNMAYDAGARGWTFHAQWNTLEPSDGVYQLDDFRGTIQYVNTRDLTLQITIQTINTVKRETPPDLMHRRWNSQQMISRMIRLIDEMGRSFNERVKYISIGNEVDIYFASVGEQEIEDYLTLFREVRQHIHSRWPWIRLGITNTYEGMVGERSWIVDRLNAETDIVILTYYPMTPGMTVRDPKTVSQDFKTMVRRSGGKPIILQEVGYPAGTLNQSSPQKQAEFVRQVFNAWDEAGTAIPFLNYFLLHDFSDDLCDFFVIYYGVNAAAFREFLCTLGLRKANGDPRPAWDAFKESAASHGFP